MSGDIFFSGWDAIVRTLVITALAYPGMLLMIRLSGHRTLAQFNAFDLIVTVALGSTLASVITSKDVALFQGLFAFFLLIGLQFLLSRLTTLSPRVERVINGEPVLLVYRGELLWPAMQRALITDEEIKSTVRSQGYGNLAELEAVILETNGKLSVVEHRPSGESSALSDIPKYER